MQANIFNQIGRRKKKKVNFLTALSFLLLSGLISFSFIGCGGGGGGSSGALEGPINPALFSGWEMTNGPFSGSIASLDVDPENSLKIFVALGRGGLFLSEDGGLSWTRIQGQLLNSRPIAVAVSPTEPGIIYLGTETYGVYKSTDGGNTWGQMSNGLPPYLNGYQPVEKVIIDPTRSDVAYAFVWNGYYVYKWQPLLGEWVKILDGTPTSDSFVGLVVNPINPDIIYASCSYQTGVWKSVDAGDNWVQKNSGLPEHIGGNVQTRSLGIDPNNPDRLYVGMFDGGLYKTDNGGESWDWMAIFPGPARRTIKSISIDPNNSSVLYVGVSCTEDISMQGLWKTADDGVTWGLVYFEEKTPFLVKIAPSNPSTVFVANAENDGLFKRIGNDLNWLKIDNGLVDSAVTTVSNIFDNTVYAGTESEGVFVTTNGGSNWVQMNNELSQLVSPLYISALAVDPYNTQKAYVGTYDDGVFLTTNGGENWDARNTNLDNKYVQTIAVYPPDSDVAYVGTRGGIFSTENGGQTWAEKSTGLTDLWITSIAIDPTSGLGNMVLYAGTGFQGTTGEVFKTTDGGDTWGEISNDLPNKPVTALVIYPSDNRIVYAGFNGEGVYFTQDGGENWVQKNNGLTSANIISLAISQGNSNVVYAGTEDEGVFATADGGDNWIQIAAGLTSALNRSVNAIAIAPNDDLGYTGTGCGVFKAYK